MADSIGYTSSPQNSMSHIPFPCALQKRRFCKPLVVETLLVLGSVLLLTLLMLFFHLSAQTSDYLLLYLLVIFVYACICGLYAALLASFVAFFAFDYFFVSPIFSLAAAKFEDLLSLLVFLIVAIITGRLASALRVYALQARRREYESRTLYECVRATNRGSDLEQQLTTFVRAVVNVFASRGIRDGMFLLADASGTLHSQGSAFQLLDRVEVSSDEEAAIAWVMASARTVDFYDRALPPLLLQKDAAPDGRRPLEAARLSAQYMLRLVPVKNGTKVFGVLRMLIEADSGKSSLVNTLGIEQRTPTEQDVFFSTFLEQAVTVVEQKHLRDASIHLAVLQQTEVQRSALFSAVSHDFRTPLATIKAAATTLFQDKGDEDVDLQQSVAATIEREVDRLDGLVENILDMSRLEAGSLRLEKVWYPLDALISDTVDHRQAHIGERNISLHFPPMLSPVELDAVQIDQVLNNLLENALRYTPEGSPLDVSIEVQESSVLVRLADRGPGIPPAERTRIFDKFYRFAESGSSGLYPHGLGLGLAICQGIIQAHEGKIWVEARDGGGAIFCFTLPYSEVEKGSIDD